MPFQFRVYFKTLIQSFSIQAPWTLPRIGIMTFLFVIFPVLQVLNFIILMLDNVFFPGYRKVQIKNPVFIIGNARSGTTYIHRLMSLDKNFSSFKAWEIMFLAVSVKKFLMWVGRVDDKLGGRAARLFERFQAWLMEESDKIHKVRMDHPEEDELVLAHLFGTPFINLVIPVPALDALTHFDELPEKQRRKLMQFYKAAVQRQLYCHGGDSVTLLSKNPLFSTKVASIIEAFPDAHIVYMARTPYETIASLHNMIDRIWNVQLQLPKDAQPRDGITNLCIYSYKYALEQIDRMGQDKNIVVRYEDLVHEPRATVEAIYARFNMPITEQFNTALVKVTSKSKGYKSEHQYSLDQFGLSKQFVFEATQDVFHRFGFNAEGEFAEDEALAQSQAQTA